MLRRTLRVLPISLKARWQEFGLLRKRERLGQPYDESLRLRLARARNALPRSRDRARGRPDFNDG